MKTFRTILIIWVIVLIIAGFCGKVFAPMRGVPPATSPQGYPIPPVIHPVVPPSEFFKKWSITEVVNSFQRSGLEIANIKSVTEVDSSSLPARPEQGIKFSIPSVREEVAGCVLSFDMEKSLEKVRKHYLSLNKKNKLYSWTFVKDNILLVLDSTLPEEKARGFEKALYELKK